MKKHPIILKAETFSELNRNVKRAPARQIYQDIQIKRVKVSSSNSDFSSDPSQVATAANFIGLRSNNLFDLQTQYLRQWQACGELVVHVLMVLLPQVLLKPLLNRLSRITRKSKPSLLDIDAALQRDAPRESDHCHRRTKPELRRETRMTTCLTHRVVSI
ncbi:hypothetical protein OH492_10490 [Vibrio chagasii]|nr:hypothetical protein [Vibrio chagasii]